MYFFIFNYCNDFASGRNGERLNKLLAIYAEHIRNLEPTEDIPLVIDEAFVTELKSKKNMVFLHQKKAQLQLID